MNIEAIKHATAKGRILKLIAAEYPGGVDFFVLWQVLSNLNFVLGRDALRAYLVYLEQIGYITLSWCEDDDGKKRITVAAATTRGLNFCDGVLTEPDPGVLRV